MLGAAASARSVDGLAGRERPKKPRFRAVWSGLLGLPHKTTAATTGVQHARLGEPTQINPANTTAAEWWQRSCSWTRLAGVAGGTRPFASAVPWPEWLFLGVAGRLRMRRDGGPSLRPSTKAKRRRVAPPGSIT